MYFFGTTPATPVLSLKRYTNFTTSNFLCGISKLMLFTFFVTFQKTNPHTKDNKQMHQGCRCASNCNPPHTVTFCRWPPETGIVVMVRHVTLSRRPAKEQSPTDMRDDKTANTTADHTHIPLPSEPFFLQWKQECSMCETTPFCHLLQLPAAPLQLLNYYQSTSEFFVITMVAYPCRCVMGSQVSRCPSFRILPNELCKE